VTALDARTGAVRYVFPFRGQDPSPGSVAPVLTGDGHWLAIPGGADPRRRRTIAVFDARDWKGRPRLLSLPAPVAALAAGRSALAVQTADHQVRLVQPPGLRTTWTGRITDGDLVALSSDGRRMAVGGPSLRLVSAGPASSTGQATIGGSDFSAVQFSPDGAELVVGTNAGSLGIYAAATGERLATLPGSAGAVVASAWARTADGEALYTAGLDSELVRWDVTGDARIRSDIPGSTLPPPNDTGQYGNTVVGDGPIEDGTYSNAGGPGERAWVLDLRSRRMRTWPLGLSRGSYVFGASATTDGELGLFTIWEQKSNRSQAWIVDLRTGHRIGRLALPPASNGYSGYSGVIAPNHKFAVESIGYNVLGIFAVPSGRLLHQYYVQFRDQPPNRFEIYPSKFDPRGGVLIYAIDDGPPAPPPPGSRQPAPTDTAPKSSRIGLLDPATGRLTAQGAVGPESITAVGWSHNKRLLAIGTVGGILQLYDARTLRRITDAGVVEGGYILTASFSPDDRTLVTGSTGDASLWSVPTLTRIGGPLLSAPDENGWWYAWFRTDGNIEGIAPTESSGLPRDTLFTVPGHPPDWAARACALAGATLSRPQWRRYFGTAPYQDTCPTR
jgi:WD40 repeat protein